MCVCVCVCVPHCIYVTLLFSRHIWLDQCICACVEAYKITAWM